MSKPAERSTLSVPAFYAWVVGQEERYELVDGRPVLMAWAGRRHDRIAVNGLRILGNALRGRSCFPFTADTYIRLPASATCRMADFGVDCGRPDEDSLEAAEPVLVAEILSPSTRAFDSTQKLEDYKSVAALRNILLVDPDAPQVLLFSRAADGSWSSGLVAGLDAVVAFPDLGLAIPLAELYEGLAFRPRPVLITPEGSAEGGG